MKFIAVLTIVTLCSISGVAQEPVPIYDQILNAGLLERMKEGEAAGVGFIKSVEGLASPNHEKEFESSNFNFSRGYLEVFSRLGNLAPDLAGSNAYFELTNEINSFVVLLNSNSTARYNNNNFKRATWNIAIGLIYQLEFLKGIMAGKREEVRDLQTFILDHLFHGGATENNDVTGSLMVLQYITAEHFNFPKDLLFRLANTLEQTAFQNKENISDGLYLGLRIGAANFYAMAVKSDTPSRENFFIPYHEFALESGLTRASELNLGRIKKYLLKERVKYLRNSGSNMELKAASIELIKASTDEIEREDILTRYAIKLRLFWLEYSDLILIVTLAFTLFFCMFSIWELGKPKVEHWKYWSEFFIRPLRGVSVAFRILLSEERTPVSLKIAFFLIPIAAAFFTTWFLDKTNNLFDFFSSL